MTQPSILLVDDDRELTEVLTEYLGPKGFGIEVAADGAQALQRLSDATYDIVILDVMLPALNGFEVLTRLRRTLETPVIMLTARRADEDRILGLELGADDYLPKPFNPAELAARIRAILRRTAPAPEAANQVIVVGPFRIHLGTLEARMNGRVLKLTGTEFRLLETFARSASSTLSRDLLAEKVLGRRLSPYDRSLDTHVSNLRRKLAQESSGGLDIRAIRGHGYVLVAGSEELQ